MRGSLVVLALAITPLAARVSSAQSRKSSMEGKRETAAAHGREAGDWTGPSSNFLRIGAFVRTATFILITIRRVEIFTIA